MAQWTFWPFANISKCHYYGSILGRIKSFKNPSGANDSPVLFLSPNKPELNKPEEWA